MDTKELIPEYVLQPHAISRAVYRLSATARKIIAMGMAIIPPDLSNRIAQFSFYEFCQAIGYEKGGESQRIFMTALDECVGCVITIDTPTEIKKFTWIQFAVFNKETNMIHIEFSKGLTDYLIELKKMYARIDLSDMGKLHSLYALRLFEMAKSYESLAGKNGNKKNEWYFDRPIEEMRKILGIEAGKYKLTMDFRRYVIERPIKEINESNLGIKITPEYIRKGKFLVSIRFKCEFVSKKLEVRKKKGVKELPAPTESPISDDTLESKELEHLKKLYPEEYVALYTAILKEPPNAFMRDNRRLWEGQVDYLTCKALRERHGIRK